jgi:hypothetical protein
MILFDFGLFLTGFKGYPGKVSFVSASPQA